MRSTQNNENFEQFSVNNLVLPKVSQVRFLGLILDENLNWVQHTQQLANKLASAYFMIKIICKYLDVSIGKLVYYALFESHLRYGIPFWGNCALINTLPIFRIQKRTLRAMYGLQSRETCRDAFSKNGILTCPSLYILETVSLVFKSISALPTNSDFHTYPTRRGDNLRLPLPTNVTFKNSPLYIGSKLYNNLPPNLKITSSFNKFRTGVKSWLLVKSFYSVEEFLNYQSNSGI